MCVLILSNTHSKKIQRDIITNVCTSSCKVPVILYWFERNSNFLDIFSKILKNEIL